VSNWLYPTKLNGLPILAVGDKEEAKMDIEELISDFAKANVKKNNF
jgi:hypothetical protein